MFLFQKFNYETYWITDDNKYLLNDISDEEIKKEIFCGFDTETTGLHIIVDKPFLVTFGYGKKIFAFEPKESLICEMEKVANRFGLIFAHNAKFDYHMIWNYLGREPLGLKDVIADSMTVARLTNYADERDSISLESLGIAYVDKDSKFASKVIKSRISEINKDRKNQAKKAFYDYYGKRNKINSFNAIWDAYKKRVAFIDDNNELFNLLDSYYVPANYYDIYNENKSLMINYAMDDIVIMLEYLRLAYPMMLKVDKDLETFNRERKLISAIAHMENNGIKVDIDYLLDSRKRILEYKNKMYERLYELVGFKCTVGQHDTLKAVFKEKYGMDLNSCDKKALRSINKGSDAYELADLIIHLRTIDKWLSTYIDGKLNNVINGKIYTEINNSGAISGRVSCDMQQQPKEALKDRDGNEIFHPRRCFVPDDGYVFIFADMSQMELRVQAFYTLLVGNGDTNLCRAYIPYKCVSIFTGKEFNVKDQNDIDNWNTGEWVLKEDQSKFWEPTDLHTLTTFTAFPFLNHDKNHPEFKHYRKLGKMCNFLKNYQGGIHAIVDQLDVPLEIAKQLDTAYYKAFPNVKEYQAWVNKQLTLYGVVHNLYGRPYFMRESKNFYKASNYVIQGTCADMIKKAELKLDNLLKDKKSKFLLPIHDEFMCLVSKDEMNLIPKIKAIMQDTRKEMPYIPMISDVEIAYKNWADKEDYENA